MKKKLLYIIYLAFVILILSEILLRIYNPFPSGIKGNKIVLRVNVKYNLTDHGIPVIDSNVVHTKNSLGFRGPDLPADTNLFRIITVGGSTTESNYISDGKTWSDHLARKLGKRFPKLWLNNAGLAGHSTFGHQVLLSDYLVKLKPKLILFLVGCNDVERDDLNESDRYSMKGSYGSVASFFTKNSELINTIANLSRRHNAISHGLTDRYLDLRRSDSILISETEIVQRTEKLHARHIGNYKKRIEDLIVTCRRNGIDPVFITQPGLLGAGRDSMTNVNLETVSVDMGSARNGKEWWTFLELYNSALKEIAGKHNVHYIDLANRLPKSSLYFYDAVHLTLEGSRMVGDILFNDLELYLSSKIK